MSSDVDDFITYLIDFGLTEKEAQCYFYLLRYGPKTPSPLARSLHTYRVDVHRTLLSLIEKGIVRPSLNSPTVYIAVEPSTALDAAFQRLQQEMQEMERRKRKLEELSRQQRFRFSDEVSTYKMLKTTKEVVSTTILTIGHTNEEFIWIVPKEGLQAASMFGINSVVQELTERGGKTRAITDITYNTIPFVQEVIDAGVEARHFEGYSGLLYSVFDRKYCMSAINIDVKRVTLDAPAIMLYTDDPVYANYLTSTFELLWDQAVPAEGRIEELIKQGPPHADE